MNQGHASGGHTILSNQLLGGVSSDWPSSDWQKTAWSAFESTTSRTFEAETRDGEDPEQHPSTPDRGFGGTPQHQEDQNGSSGLVPPPLMDIDTNRYQIANTRNNTVAGRQSSAPIDPNEEQASPSHHRYGGQLRSIQPSNVGDQAQPQSARRSTRGASSRYAPYPASQPARRGRGRGRAGYQQRGSRQQNISTQRYSCGEHERSFGTRSDLERHYNDVHHTDIDGNPIELFYCPVEGCKRHQQPFVRPQNFETHMSGVHGRNLPDAPTDDAPTHETLVHNAPSHEAWPALPNPALQEEASILPPAEAVSRPPFAGADGSTSETLQPLDETESTNVRLVAMHGICYFFEILLADDSAMLAAKMVEIQSLEDEYRRLGAKLRSRMQKERAYAEALEQGSDSEPEGPAHAALVALRTDNASHSLEFEDTKVLLDALKSTYDQMKWGAKYNQLSMVLYGGKLMEERRQYRQVQGRQPQGHPTAPLAG